MSAGVAAQSGNTGLPSTNGSVSGQVNPGYPVSTGYEGVSRPLEDITESNLAPHFRSHLFIFYGWFSIFIIYKSKFIHNLHLMFQCFLNSH